MPEQSFDGIDDGKSFDWGRTSADYDRFRPGPPESFYRRLQALGIGLPGQRILDLGTGTGLLARRFASLGVKASGIDVSTEQIAMAEVAAARDGVQVDFQVARAEALPFGDHQFDVLSANQCWLYFDLDRTIPEVCRVLREEGLLLVSHFSFMPRLDPLVEASESLVLKFNPLWSGADWDGVIPAEPRWAEQRFELVGLFVYDEQIPFTRESWRGRMRALRGIAASLPVEQVKAFDLELAALLAERVDEQFSVWHRIHAQIFRARSPAEH